MEHMLVDSRTTEPNAPPRWCAARYASSTPKRNQNHALSKPAHKRSTLMTGQYSGLHTAFLTIASTSSPPPTFVATPSLLAHSTTAHATLTDTSLDSSIFGINPSTTSPGAAS